jgi:hypothetical protein
VVAVSLDGPFKETVFIPKNPAFGDPSMQCT